MSELNNIIEIVFDRTKRKLRARSIQDGRWVRFPNNLRKENATFIATKMKQGRGDSWIASGQREFKITSDKNILLEEILNIKNKLLLNQFYSVIFDDCQGKVNTEMLNIIFVVKKIRPEIDEQLLLPLIKKYSHSAFIPDNLILPLQNMLASYNDKRIVKMFSNYEQDDFLEDSVIMYQRLLENDLEIDQVLPPKPKNIREIHTILTRESSKIKQLKYKLNQDDFYNGIMVGEYEIFIPQTSHDLIEIGNQLSICVGNGYYAEQILKKYSKVLCLKKDNKFKYCIEFSYSSNNIIIQARGFANANMDKKLVDLLLSTLKNTNKEKQVNE